MDNPAITSASVILNPSSPINFDRIYNPLTYDTLHPERNITPEMIREGSPLDNYAIENDGGDFADSVDIKKLFKKLNGYY